MTKSQLKPHFLCSNNCVQCCNLHSKAVLPEYSISLNYIINTIIYHLLCILLLSFFFTVPTPFVANDSQHLQVYNTTTSLDLTCSASIKSTDSPYVDVFTSAVFEWKYIRGGSEFSEILPTSTNDSKTYTSSLSLHNINLTSAGEYTCDVYLYSNFSFVKDSTHKSNKTTIRINGK